MAEPERTIVKHQRWRLLREINALTEKPLIVLSLVWLLLLIIEFTQGLNRPLAVLGYTIWALFIADFLIEFTIAPQKLIYLRHNWLTLISLALPALRVFQVFRAVRFVRAARATRSVRLVRLLTSLNRGIRSSRRVLARHGVGYVVVITAIVTFAGAAGMATFESPAALISEGFDPEAGVVNGLQGYGDALWWTAMVMTTMGSEYWPKTLEGRILGWLLSLYAFAVFGYITATLASWFIGRDASTAAGQAAAEAQSAEAVLRRELVAVRQELSAARRDLARLLTQVEGAPETPAARRPR